MLLVTQHHIVSDGWSLGILVREVAALYTAFRRGESDPLPPLEIQYADYAQWQRSWLQGEELTRQFEFWKDASGGRAGAARTCRSTGRGRRCKAMPAARVPFVLSAGTDGRSAGVLAASRRDAVHDAALGLGLLLSRLRGQTDVVIGTPVANRQRREVERSDRLLRQHAGRAAALR